MKAYQAYALGKCVTAHSPREAAKMFFAKYPVFKECNILEGGMREGKFYLFTELGITQAPLNLRRVQKNKVNQLPED